MLNSNYKLSKEVKSSRDGFGEALVEKGDTNDRIVVLTADLTESTRVNLFADKFPDRFFSIGVSEQALVTVASGMALYGKIPFVSSYAAFSPARNWEQIKTTIALNNVPVKIVGAHAGLSASLYGATHLGLEDIALMRVIPNMVVEVPCDALEAKKAVYEIVKNNLPTYLRLSRAETPVITTPKTPYKIGRAEVVWEDKDPQVVIIACGSMVYESLLAAKALTASVLVINCHTIKPLDERTIIRAARTCGAVVTVEEHQINGGMGSAVAEVLARNFPVPIEFIGMSDSFGESGKYEELTKKYGLKSKNIIEAVKMAISRKNA